MRNIQFKGVLILLISVGFMAISSCKKNEFNLLEKQMIGTWKLKAFLTDKTFNGFDSSDIQSYIDPNKSVTMKLGDNHYLQHYIDGVPVFNFDCYWTVVLESDQNENRRIYLRPNYENADRVHDVDRLDDKGLILYYTWSKEYDPILKKYEFVRLGYWYVKDN